MLHSRRTEKSLALIVLLLGAVAVPIGCSSTGRSTAQELREAEQLRESDPDAALVRLETFTRRHPNHVGGQRALALVLEELDRPQEAIAAWARVLSSPEANAAATDEAHQATGRLVLRVLGPPPHRVTDGPAAEAAAWVDHGERAFQALIDRKPRDPSVLYGRALMQYYRGAFAAAATLLSQLLEQEPNNFAARYLQKLNEEHLVGISARLIREFAAAIPSAPAEVRRELVLHLLDIANRDGLDDRSRFEVTASLEELQSGPSLPVELRQEIVALSAERQRMADRARARDLARAAERAKERNEWSRGWLLLTEAVKLDESHGSERRAFGTQWAQRLTIQLTEAVKQEDADAAETFQRQLEQIPLSDLPSDLAGTARQVLADYRVFHDRVGLAAQLGQVERLLADSKPEEAIKILDEIEPRVSPSGRVEFDILYSRALAGWGREAEALEILDELYTSGRLQAHRDNVVYRVYGLLLAEAERGDMARRVLEDLPLNLFNSAAFEALIHALEQQGEWETILARLESLSFVPETYRASLRKAAAEAARRRLRTGDPDGALRLLESYLQKPDFETFVVQEVYLLVLIELGDFDRASDLILTADPAIVGSIPQRMLTEVKQKALRELTGFAQFQLFEKLLEIQPDAEVKGWTVRLWPQYGSYLPKPGNYTIAYEIRDLTPDGKVKRSQQVSWKMTWQDGGFEVDLGNGNTEEWREVEGTWLRIADDREEQLPVRVEGSPPYRVVQFESGDQLWSAQVVSAGISVTVGRETYEGCLEIRLVNEENQSHTQTYFVAPRVGTVRWEEAKLGAKEKVREIIGLSPR